MNAEYFNLRYKYNVRINESYILHKYIDFT